ncbi:MAG: SURF1 family protein [Comamonadaceae bacterium]|nr:MAG: SURF1 family protein [Comamonadaceae bacterium]
MPPSRRIGWIAFALASLLAVIGLLALGVWQVERRSWKLALIERVDRRIHASPEAAPPPARWPMLSADDEYRRLRLQGRFVAGRQALVQASTARGAGFWVMTPLRTDDAGTVLVNRGFVESARDAGEPDPSTPVDLVGLLRTSEPGGGFLRHNDPAAGRWYSRDVQAIAAALGLSGVAPYFVDAEAAPAASAAATAAATPVAGLTVIAFRNHHLVYALTWFALAAMMAAGAGHVLRDGWRRHRHGARHERPD